MSVHDFRTAIESAIPLWVPLVIGLGLSGAAFVMAWRGR